LAGCETGERRWAVSTTSTRGESRDGTGRLQRPSSIGSIAGLNNKPFSKNAGRHSGCAGGDEKNDVLGIHFSEIIASVGNE